MTIPVTIIGGYLGAGKTTLLNRMLSQTQSRIAVLVNDFGSINIDASLIENDNGSVVSLTNGCVCCSIGDDLGETLYALLEEDSAPEHILIEASGAADPAKVAGYTMGDPRTSLNRIVTLADGKTIKQRRKDKFVGRLIARQLSAADMVLISRGDLLDDHQQQTITEWLKQEAPTAEHSFSQNIEMEDILTSAKKTRSRLDSEFHPPLFGKASQANLPELDHDRFVQWANSFPETVARAKGFVTLSGSRSGRHLFHHAGGHWELTPYTGDENDALVLITSRPDNEAQHLMSQLLQTAGDEAPCL